MVLLGARIKWPSTKVWFFSSTPVNPKSHSKPWKGKINKPFASSALPDFMDCCVRTEWDLTLYYKREGVAKTTKTKRAVDNTPVRSVDSIDAQLGTARWKRASLVVALRCRGICRPCVRGVAAVTYCFGDLSSSSTSPSVELSSPRVCELLQEAAKRLSVLQQSLLHHVCPLTGCLCLAGARSSQPATFGPGRHSRKVRLWHWSVEKRREKLWLPCPKSS